MLQGDWYVVPQAATSDYTEVAIATMPGRTEAMRKYTKNVTPAKSIPFEEYDLVISFDAILKVPRNHRTLFAYFAQEHWDRLYTDSLRKPAAGYDLFLAHMMDARSTLTALPQSVSFPYVHDTNLVRSIFPGEKREAAWFDWRALMTLGMRDTSEPWSAEGDAAAGRLQELLDMPIRYRGQPHAQTYGFADPPAWGDAAMYLQELSRCKYFVSVGGRIGAGQGLAEAAAAGCLCIGQEDRAYQKLICHPACLCEDMAEMPTRLKALRSSEDLQREVLAYQDRALRTHFERGPLNLLREAVQMKSEKYGNQHQ